MPATSRAITFARRLRKSLTRSEVVLWTALRGKRLAGLRFRRQHPIGAYVVDFYCARHRLVVEVDGAAHSENVVAGHDAERDLWIERQGVQILRIPADFVLTDVGAALETIAMAVETSRGR